MAEACADLIVSMAANAGIAALVGTRIYGGAVPDGATLPFIWLQRRAVEFATELENESEPLFERFDIECASDDSREAIQVSDAVRAWAKAWTDAATHTMNSHTYTWVGVSDAAEDYAPRNIDASERLFISSLDLEIVRP